MNNRNLAPPGPTAAPRFAVAAHGRGAAGPSNADLQFITDAGHFPMYETPVYLATLVESHLHAHRD